MGILTHEYQGDGVYRVRTTKGAFNVDWADPFGERAEIRSAGEFTAHFTGSNDQCREWLEANT